MMNVLPIVVLYNTDFHTTNVWQTLLCHEPDCQVLLYENSLEPLNQRYASDQVLYHHDPNNGGVSAAYNYGACQARQLEGVEAVLLLDEDTCFESDYLKVLRDLLQAHPDINLFVPQVLYQGDFPFSPIRRGLRWHRGVSLPEGQYSLYDYLPVNSGACIRLSVFERVGGYQDAIRLDFADFDFFARLAEVSADFWRIDRVAQQSFSNSETDIDRLYRRYLFYLEGAREARKNKLIRRMVDVGVLRHTLALTARTNSLRFIKKYLFR